jgi:azurin
MWHQDAEFYPNPKQIHYSSIYILNEQKIMDYRYFNVTGRAAIKLLAAVFIVGLVASCGGDSRKSTPPGVVPSEQPGASSVAPGGVVKVVINGNDQMKFDTEEIRVRAGSKVSLTLNHIGSLPKEAMGHNVVILGKGVDVGAFASKAVMAKDNDYIPEGFEIVAHTKMLGGGESTSITFEAPAAGTYDFICSFPGHYAMMRGKFIVE